MLLTEYILKQNPNIRAYRTPSLDQHQCMDILEMPKLDEWAATSGNRGVGLAKICHHTPRFPHFCWCRADYQLVKSLGLKSCIKIVMLYDQDCFAGDNVLRIAKDLAENNTGSRVLAVCTKMTVVNF